MLAAQFILVSAVLYAAKKALRSRLLPEFLPHICVQAPRLLDGNNVEFRLLAARPLRPVPPILVL